MFPLIATKQHSVAGKDNRCFRKPGSQTSHSDIFIKVTDQDINGVSFQKKSNLYRTEWADIAMNFKDFCFYTVCCSIIKKSWLFFASKNNSMPSFCKLFCRIYHPFFSTAKFISSDGVDKKNVHVFFFLLRISLKKSMISACINEVENFFNTVRFASWAILWHKAGLW